MLISVKLNNTEAKPHSIVKAKGFVSTRHDKLKKRIGIHVAAQLTLREDIIRKKHSELALKDHRS